MTRLEEIKERCADEMTDEEARDYREVLHKFLSPGQICGGCGMSLKELLPPIEAIKQNTKALDKIIELLESLDGEVTKLRQHLVHGLEVPL